MMTISDLAKQCGVSRATVSLALNGKYGVSENIRQRILAAASRGGYQARQYRRERQVLLIAGEAETFINGEYYAQMLNALAKTFRENGYEPLVIPLSRLNLVKSLDFDAAICLPTDKPELSYMWGQENPNPFIQLNLRGRTHDNFYNIASDDDDFIDQSVDYLVRKGHSRIGIFLITKEGQDILREKCFRQAMARRNLHEMGFVEYGGLSDMNVLGRLMMHRITALICPCEGLGVRIIHALWQFKVRVPRDLSLISSEIANISEYWNPPLTTFGQNFTDFARIAVNIIEQNQTGKKDIPHEYLLPYQFYERDSVCKIIT